MTQQPPKETPSNPGRTALAVAPSQSYKAARETLVYRLSELVFGSLLAGYVLGFTGFAAVVVAGGQRISEPDSFNRFLLIGLQAGTYACISATFAYLTAALYLRYHTGILTMPTAPLEDARHDFTIAVSQGFLFGFAMLIPEAFCFSVAVTLLVSLARHRREHQTLVNYFANSLNNVGVGPPDPKAIRHTRDADANRKLLVQEEIRESKMNGWVAVPSWLHGLVWVLLLIGIAVLVCPLLLIPDEVSRSWVRAILNIVGGLVLLFLVYGGTQSIIAEGADFLSGDKALEELDKRYFALESRLLAKKNNAKTTK